MKIQVGLEFSHLCNFTSRLIHLRIKRVNLCSNDTMGTRNILQTTNHRHSKYPEKFNSVKEGKKLGPEIAYGRTHSYGSSAFELSRCLLGFSPETRLKPIAVQGESVCYMLYMRTTF